MKLIRTTIVIALLILTVSTAYAADDFADALPQDALVVVRVTDLHDAWKQFTASETWWKIEQAPIPDIANGIAIARAEIENVEATLGIDVETCAASIFGNDVALVLFADQTGAFIARSADTVTLDQTVDMILNMEAADGKTYGQTNSIHHGVTITGVQMFGEGAGVTDGAAGGRYHARVGNILAVSQDMRVVERVIDVIKNTQPALSASPEYKQALALMPERALVRVYIDTDRLAEVFDLEKALNGSMRNPVVRVMARRMRTLLPSTRFLAGSLTDQEKSVVCKYSIAYDEEALPDTMRAMLPKSNAPLDITRFVPDSALLSCAAQVNKVALWRCLLEALRESNAQAATKLSAAATLIGQAMGGLDFEKQLLPQIGDRSAFIVLPGPENHPPALAFILELNDGEELPTALRTLAGSAAMVSQMEAQKNEAEAVVTLEQTEYKNVSLMTLHLKQPELQGMLNPTLFARDRFLVISTTPESAKTIVDAASSPLQTNAPANGTLVSRTRLNLEGIGRALGQYRDFFIGQALKEGKTAEQARNDLDSLAFLLGLFKDVEMQGVHVKGRIDREVRLSY